MSEIFNDSYIDIVESITGKRQEGSHCISLNTKNKLRRKSYITFWKNITNISA